jgi:hypothetical protein
MCLHETIDILEHGIPILFYSQHSNICYNIATGGIITEEEFYKRYNNLLFKQDFENILK